MLFLLPQVPPHKPIFGASLEQRLEMMQLAVEDRPYATVGLSTHGLFLDMYQGLLRVYPPQTEVFFLTGRDAAERILTWPYDDAEAALRQMFTAFQLIVCDREGPFRLPDDPLSAPLPSSHPLLYIPCQTVITSRPLRSASVATGVAPR